MLRSSIALLFAFFLALNVLALPLRANHSHPPTFPTRASAVSDALHHSVPDAAAARMHDALAVKMHMDLLQTQPQKRQIGGVVKAIVKGISKLISKIVEKVKAKRRAKKARNDPITIRVIA
ncbi:hypothetical protein J132_04278 [Termitomyces sp. J132]|nr:hypothetical protein J132_04278 [Termitomyces sp. J132]